MPLNSKEEKILRSMTKRYGAKKGKSVFYASATAGKLGSEIKKRHGAKRRKRKMRKK